MIVLDASALLALLFRENGWEAVASRLSESKVSAVNLAEVFGRLRRDERWHELREALAGLPLDVAPFTATDAEAVALLEPLTRRFGLSLADRACLALGIQENCRVLTSDRTWLKLGFGPAIDVIR